MNERRYRVRNNQGAEKCGADHYSFQPLSPLSSGSPAHPGAAKETSA
jgi:hypothetical protein